MDREWGLFGGYINGLSSVLAYARVRRWRYHIWQIGSAQYYWVVNSR